MSLIATGHFKISKIIVFVFLGFALLVSSNPAAAEKLKSREYAKHKDTMGVVILDVNWGRRWDCGGYDNAQLINLTFELIPTAAERSRHKYSSVILKTPSRLFAKPEYRSYGFVIKPGQYALTEFRIKVARSMNDVGHISAMKNELVEDGQYYGGTFTVGAGEIVYVGHFFLDCLQSPIPWRYYSERDDTFAEYVADRRRQFRFLDNAKIVYRLFNTTNFGVDHLFRSGLQNELAGNYLAARNNFEEALEFAETSNAGPAYESAVLYNLGRMYGYSCDFETAEKLLADALQKERALEEPDDGNITKRLGELARLSFDMGQFRISASYYAEAVDRLDQLTIENDDPLGYADFLEAYALTLDQTGGAAIAVELRNRADLLRSENEGKDAEFTFVDYSSVCGDSID